MKRIEEQLAERFIWDLKKPDIDRVDRALIIKKYMNKHKISGREFARRFDIPKSTIEDWLLFLKISKQELKELEKKGFGRKDIYKKLRSSKHLSNRGSQKINFNIAEMRLDRIIELLDTFPCKRNYNFEIQEKLNKIKDLINKLELSLR